ncbi:MAG TPA: alpha/beta fold hydrolase, partial [Dehalococcoidia bacterium]|nr:alpha/beta fold hydrolase [Dehalococcoidia bacterium]
MIDRWLAHRLAGEAIVRAGGEMFRRPQPDRFGCLLIHGWAGSPAEMRPIGDYLTEHGIDVLGIRLAGHGTSTWDLNRYDEQDWLDSVEQAIEDYLREKDRIVLCGFSMGGLLTLRKAAERADDPRIAGVVTLSAPIQFRRGPGVRRATLGRLWRRLRTRRPLTMKPDAGHQLVSYNLVTPRAIVNLLRL